MTNFDLLFAPEFYANLNPDLEKAGIDTVEELEEHFLGVGLQENRPFSPWVDLEFYALSNPELEIVGIDTNQELFEHLQNDGLAKGLRFSPLVDLDFYLEQNPELEEEFGNNLESIFQHLQTIGINENRSFIRNLSLDDYLAANPDVNELVEGSREGALEHLAAFGISQGRVGAPASLDSDSAQIQTVKEMLKALVTDNKQDFLELQTPDVVWQVDGNLAPSSLDEVKDANIIPFAGNWFGTQGFSQTVGDFFERTQESIEIVKFEPLEFFQNGNLVIARVNVEATVKETGLSYEHDAAYVIELEDREDGRYQVETVRVVYESYYVAQAFAGQIPSPQAFELFEQDPLTGESLSVDPDADTEESLRVVQDAYQTLVVEGNTSGFLDFFADDVTFVHTIDPAIHPGGGIRQGREALDQFFFETIPSFFNVTVLNQRHIIANGDRVIVFNDEEIIGRTNDIPFEGLNSSVHGITVKDGLITDWHFIIDNYGSASALAGRPLFTEGEAVEDPIEPVFSSVSNEVLDIADPNDVFDGVGDKLVEASQVASSFSSASDGERIFSETELDRLSVNNFSLLFDANFYADLNPDLAESGIDTVEELEKHFLNVGLRENRPFSPWVDLEFYALSNPELGIVGVETREELFNHLQDEGLAQGLRFSPLVDLEFYLAENPELEADLGSDLSTAFQHLQTVGVSENLSFSRNLDLDEYLAANPDVNEAVGGSREGALDHLAAFGIDEEREGAPASLDSGSAQLQTVRAMLEAFATGNKQDFLALQTPDVVWDVDGNLAPSSLDEVKDTNIIPFAGEWFGTQGFSQTVEDFFDRTQESIEITKFEPLEFFQDGDLVITRVNVGATVTETGLSYEHDAAYVIELEDRKDGRYQVETVRVVYESYYVAQAFAGQIPSPQAFELFEQDPLTGESLSVEPDADTEESLRVVQDAYQTLVVEGNIPGFLDFFADDATFVHTIDPAIHPGGGIRQGREALDQFFGTVGEFFTLRVVNPRHIIANGDRVVVFNDQETTVNANGIPFELNSIHGITVKDGLISDWQFIINNYASTSALAGQPLFVEEEAVSEPFEPVFGSIDNDLLDVADPSDNFEGNQDIVFAGVGDDIVDASQGALGGNRIFGGIGVDELFAGTHDRLFGGAGSDILDASVGSGRNRLYGGDGDDELFAGGDDRLFGGDGDDILDASVGSGNNRLYSQAGNDTLIAGRGDHFIGGDGDDAFFVTDGGDNLITGGAGADAFWIATGELPPSGNIITDLEVGMDAIGVGGVGAASVDDLDFSQVDADTIISFSGFDLITLLNTSASVLQTNGTFVFA